METNILKQLLDEAKGNSNSSKDEFRKSISDLNEEELNTILELEKEGSNRQWTIDIINKTNKTDVKTSTKKTNKIEKEKSWQKDKIKVIIHSRDTDQIEGFVGLNGYTAQFKVGEEVELPKIVVETLKSKGNVKYWYESTANGNIKKSKFESRYIIESV